MRRDVTAAGLVAVTVLGAAACGGQARPPVARSSVSTASDTSAPGQPSPPASPSASPVAPARRAPSAVVAEAPRLAILPSGRSVPVRSVGTTAEGLLDVPDDIDLAGWWRGGSRLGDPFGSVLLAAHVDSRSEGLGPFAELLGVPAGARIRLRSDNLDRTYEVRSRRLVPQGLLDDDSWIYDVSGDSRLTLVTCAPPYDASRGGYQNLAVVTALPLDRP